MRTLRSILNAASLVRGLHVCQFAKPVISYCQTDKFSQQPSEGSDDHEVNLSHGAEEAIVLAALRSVIEPQLPASDIHVMNGIIGDVFSIEFDDNITLSEVTTEELRQAAVSVCCIQVDSN